MRPKPTHDPDALLSLLRRGDPARPIAEEEADGILRRVRHEISRAPAPASRAAWGWRTALLAACALLVAVALWRIIPGRPVPQAPSLADRPAPAGAPVERLSVLPEPRSQQIQFRTPGGTRIIWILTPGVNTERRAL